MKWKIGGYRPSSNYVESRENTNNEEKKVEKLNLPLFFSIVKDRLKNK